MLTEIIQTQTIERITGTQERWRRRLKRLPSDWCREHRYLGPGQSFAAKEEAIRYDFALTPYAEEAVDDLVHPDVMTTVWQWASDLGKTETASNLIGHKIAEDPTKILVLYPIDRSARTWAKECLEPMIEHSPTLRGRVAEKRSRDSKNTISHKIFPGGSISVIAGGSKSNFRQRRAGVVIGDEIDALKGDIGGEGDPVSLLFKRTEGYEDSIQLLMSTPTIKGHSRIEWWFNRSDKRFWFVPCRKCGAWFHLEWKFVEWPKGKPEQALILCPECPATHNDEQRKRMIRDGHWRPTAPFHGVRGRHLNGLYSLFPAKKGYRSKLHQFAKDCIDAAHSNNKAATVKVWVNTFLAETYLAESDITPDWRPLYDRREPYNPDEKIPQGVIRITFGTDFQDDRVEVVFVGWGRNNYESWGLGRHVLNSSPKFPTVYGELETVLLKTFVREDGARMTAKAGGFDTGFPSCIKILYEWLRPRQRRGWYACKGSNMIDADPVSRSQSSKVDRVTLFMVGTNRIKEFIYNRLTLAKPDGEDFPPGFAHFPDCYDEEFFRQLLSEESRAVHKNGVQYRQFALPQGATPEGGTKRNEVLDCWVLAEAALYARGFTNWDYEEKLNLESVPVIGNPDQNQRPEPGWFGQQPPAEETTGWV